MGFRTCKYTAVADVEDACKHPKCESFCFHSFNNYVWSLPEESRMEIPYSFPYVEGIRWDYDSFLRKIYRYLWRTGKDCGFVFSLEEDEDTEVQKPKPVIRNEIVGNVEEILDGECHSSKYDYSFNMKIKLNEGIIVEELKNAKNSNKTMTISFLHNIYLMSI